MIRIPEVYHRTISYLSHTNFHTFNLLKTRIYKDLQEKESRGIGGRMAPELYWGVMGTSQAGGEANYIKTYQHARAP